MCENSFWEVKVHEVSKRNRQFTQVLLCIESHNDTLNFMSRAHFVNRITDVYH